MVLEELVLHLGHLHPVELLQLLNGCLVPTGNVKTALDVSQEWLQLVLLPGGGLLRLGDVLDGVVLPVEAQDLLDDATLI